MPEWSKGYDLRSYGVSLVGSNPAPIIIIVPIAQLVRALVL